jgi:4-oxalocrotonate tautomerase
MPLVYVTLAEGTTSQHRRAQIGDGIYRALIDVANVPQDDRFQVINEVPSANLIYSPDYMGFDRSPSVVFIQIFFNAGRSVDVKRALYAADRRKSGRGRGAWRRYCHQPRRNAQRELVVRAR